MNAHDVPSLAVAASQIGPDFYAVLRGGRAFMMNFGKLSCDLFILGLLFLAACSDNHPKGNTTVVTVYPDRATTVSLGEAEAYFQVGAVQRVVKVTLSANKDTSQLPEDINPITSIYTISFSDPTAYATEEDEATLRFTPANGGTGVVYYSNDNMESWKYWGGIQRGQSIEVVMAPGSTGNFVVGEAPLSESDDTGTAYLMKGPYLMLTGKNTEMEVLWETTGDTNENYDTLTVKWEKQDGSGSGESPNLRTDGYPNHYIITNLTPGTRYNYKIMFGEYWYFSGDFMTPPVDNATETTFYAYGDTRTQPADHNDVVHVLRHDAVDNGMADIRQTFVLHTGDFVHRGLDDSYWDNDYFAYRHYVSTNEFLASFPIMPAIGNHEFKDSDGTVDMDAYRFRALWPNPLYPTPAKGSTQSYYYSFDYGPVHISIIDPYSISYAPGSAQYEWLQSDLENTAKQWKIVVCHHPFYDAGSGSPKGDVGNYADTRTLQSDIQPLLEKNNVQLVLQGHRHYYSHSIVNGITYLVLGDGGAPQTDPYDLSDLPSYDVPYEKAVRGYHFARIDVAPSGLTVNVIREIGAEPHLIDTVSIAP